uniref:Uncharacterized protein n=1 Tax=Ascaris lumbricoides TaxID=6252 RepID=A0A9J2P306_ASCLU
MIGILNCGGDQADEFYASGRRSSLYGKTRNSSRTVSYGTGGRVFIDGQPLRKNTTGEMWDELLKLISTHNALEKALRGRAASGAHFSRSNGEIFTKLRSAIRQQESNDKCKLEASGNEVERSCVAKYLESCA